MTAVEWIEDHLELVLSGHIKIESIIKQAKEIEKKQIINAFYDGGNIGFYHYKTFDNYYDQQFKKK